MNDRRAARDKLLIKIAQALELVLVRLLRLSDQTRAQLHEAAKILEEFTKEDEE